jgi:hypothetical protein
MECKEDENVFSVGFESVVGKCSQPQFSFDKIRQVESEVKYKNVDYPCLLRTSATPRVATVNTVLHAQSFSPVQVRTLPVGPTNRSRQNSERVISDPKVHPWLGHKEYWDIM